MTGRPRLGAWTAARWFVLRSAGLPRSLLEEVLAPSRHMPTAAEDETVEECRTQELVRLRAAAADPRLRWAVSWQNARMLRDVLDPLIASEGLSRNAKRRQREQTAARYLQRYTAKNETIGHFGPSTWGRFTDGPTTLDGPGDTTTAVVRWELWAWQALTEAMVSDPLVRPHGIAVRHPLLHWTAESVRLFGQPLSLTAEQRDVLRRCTRPVPVGRLPDDGLSVLVDQGLVTVQVPLDAEDPATSVRRFLHSGVTEAARDRWLRVVAEAERRLVPLQKRDRPAEEVADLLAEAAGWLTQVTGDPAQRNPGRTYGARTPIFCDARRDVELDLSSGILSRAAALEGVLDSGARICQAAATAMTDVFDSVLGGRPSAPLVQVWPDLVGPGVSAARSAAAETATAERRSWYDAVGVSDDDARHRVVAAWQDVSDRLPAPPPHDTEWIGAGLASPDVMVCGTSGQLPDRPRLVLGEVHLGVATVLQRAFTVTHPAIERLRDELAEAIAPRPHLRPVDPVYSVPRQSYRTGPDLRVQRGPRVALRTPPLDASAHWIAADALTVVRDAEGWRVVADDGSRYPLVDVFSSALTAIVVDQLQLYRPAGHTPRITIDDLVLTRESWTLPPPDLGSAPPADQRSLRALLDRLGAPPRGYVKAAGEKPVLVDVQSPTYADLLLKVLRAAARSGSSVRFTEELPGRDELWLRDGDGELVTSELRMTFHRSSRRV